jgi:hypothetical protein
VPIRPHHRTMLALHVIVLTPGLSDREVAAAVGINPEGGFRSELLRPLKQRGLIENASTSGPPREPNAWLMTPYGHRVLEVIADSFAAAHRREEAEWAPGRATSRPAAGSTSQHGEMGRRAA